MGKVCLKGIVFALLCIFMCGCSLIADLFSPEEPFDPSMNPTWTDGKPRVRPGVVLVVQVGIPGEQPVVMETQVDQSGCVTLQYMLTEPVLCDGLTLEACQKKILKAYQRFIRQPQVTVRFAAFDTATGVSPYGTVNVLGEVGHPGPVNMPPTMDLTVTKALQAAGWLRPFADKRRIRVTRCERDGTRSTFFVDIVEIGEKGHIEKDMPLRAGDVVYVHETYW